MIFTIAWRELRNLFISPLAWSILALVQLVQGLIFYRLLQSYQHQPSTDTTLGGATYHVAALSLGSASYAALLIVPLLTMFLVSGERRQKSLPLLMSAPLSATEIVLGKYLGVLCFIGIMAVLLLLMPLSLAGNTTLDYGLLAASILGLLMLLASYAALGLLMSCLATTPALAALGSITMLLLLWLLEMLAATGIPWLDSTLAYLSIFQHLEPMLRGQVDTADLAYFIIFITGCIMLSALQLRRT
jgi:ABC-2 type transport system permease protein